METEQAVLEGVIAVRAALHARSRQLHRILIQADKDDRPVAQLEQRAHAAGVAVERVPADAIDSVASGTTHGGVVALAGPRRFVSLEELGADVPVPFLALLDGIEDPFNFGYALRSLYAAGAHGAALGPRNWMSAAGTVARASAGASELLPLAVAEPLEALERCSARGLAVVCSAADRDARSLYDADLRRPLLLVIGGERRGISSNILARADAVVRIPYGRDFRRSLGTTSAAAILAFEVLRQRRPTRTDMTGVVPWTEFARSAPELAERGAVMLRSFTLGYLATLRRDGSPRIHPVTVTIDDTGIYVYVVAGTPKERDLRRDPRYAIHAFPTFLDGDFRDDEFAFGGRASEITDRSVYETVAAKHNDTIHEGDPLFRLDLSWALHKRREPGRGAVYLRWRLGTRPGDPATMARP